VAGGKGERGLLKKQVRSLSAVLLMGGDLVVEGKSTIGDNWDKLERGSRG